MIKNKYLFSSRFLDYLKNQKISDKETYEGFVKTLKSINVSGESNNQIDDANYTSIISYLQFAFPNLLETYNKTITDLALALEKIKFLLRPDPKNGDRSGSI